MKFYVTVIKLGSSGVVAPIELFVSAGDGSPEQHRLGVRIDLSDFIKGLSEEIGSPALLLTKTQLLAKLQLASNNILTNMKSETKSIV
jgi:hypothetical protein